MSREWIVDTVETVHRRYRVTAEDDEQARHRFHLFFREQEILREGIVRQADDYEQDVTSRKVQKITSAGPVSFSPEQAAVPPDDD